MGAAGGLGFGGGVPPRVVVDDGVGLRQVQAGAAGLQADQEQRDLARGEAGDGAVAVLGLAGELGPGEAALLQLLLDQAEHGGELREQQHLAAFGQHLGELLHQQLQLGRLAQRLGSRHRGQQPRVAADLAQLQQRVQDLDLRLRQALVGQRVAHRLLGRQADRLVQVGLRAAEGDAHRGLLLGGQLAGHLRLAAPQQEGRDPAAQLVEPLGVAVLLDRRAERLLEARRAAQEARHQEVEQAPQLAQVVLQRRARQAQPVPRVQARHHLRRLGAGVLDVLRLVQHHQVPGLGQPLFTVALQQRVGRDDQVVLCEAGGLRMPAAAVPHPAAQGGGEAGRLALPVAQQAHRRHHQAGPVEPAGLLLGQQVRQGLQRLAQAHVVGQDAGQPLRPQELQPPQAVVLVGPQRGAQALGHRHVGQRALAAQGAQQAAQLVGAVPPHAVAHGGGQPQGFGARQAQQRVFQVLRAAVAHQVDQGLQPGLERGRRQPQETAVRPRAPDPFGQVGAVGGGLQLGQQFGQPGQHVLPHAVDLDAQRQVEPGRRRSAIGGAAVERQGFAAGRHQAHVQRVGLLHESVQIAVDLQHAAGCAQRREIAGGPVEPGRETRARRGRQQVVAALAVVDQPQRLQGPAGLHLGGQLPVQQHPPAAVLDQHAALVVRPAVAQAVVVEEQGGAQQAVGGPLGRRYRRQAQVRHGRHALHRLGHRHGGRQRQAGQPAQQHRLLPLEGRLRNRRGVQQQVQVFGGHARRFGQAAAALVGVQVERGRAVEQQGARRGVLQPGAQGPDRLGIGGAGGFLPLPGDRAGRRPAQRRPGDLLLRIGQEKAPGAGGQLQRQQPGLALQPAGARAVAGAGQRRDQPHALLVVGARPHGGGAGRHGAVVVVRRLHLRPAAALQRMRHAPRQGQPRRLGGAAGRALQVQQKDGAVYRGGLRRGRGGGAEQVEPSVELRQGGRLRWRGRHLRGPGGGDGRPRCGRRLRGRHGRRRGGRRLRFVGGAQRERHRMLAVAAHRAGAVAAEQHDAAGTVHLQQHGGLVRLAVGALHLAVDPPLCAAGRFQRVSQHLLAAVDVEAPRVRGLGDLAAQRLRVQQEPERRRHQPATGFRTCSACWSAW